MTTNHSLDAIKAKFPKNRQHDIQAAFDLGKTQLAEALATKPRPVGTSPAVLPGIPKTILYAAIFTKLQDSHLQEARFDAAREEKMHLGRMQTQNAQNLGYLRGLLDKYLRIVDTTGQLTNRAATDSYLDDYAVLVWETVDALLGCSDPVKATSLMRLIQHEGLESIQLAPDTEPTMKAA